ncbi:LmbE family protein [Haloferula helveola]|uniref:LmbE family protein n=1 Tax=Haloferula helveola TaxID=490095 RepID=A0ABM7RLG6_9BACT|nr:LmbE family protein [Haloferula helveola]
MNLTALQHLIRAATALAEDLDFLVLGSASLLASFPELGEATAPLASTYDADICPEPFDELTGTMLEEALGEDRAYFRRHGYHADVLRSSILDTLPSGWRGRLVDVPECPKAKALDPIDLAAIKLQVARPKDLDLVRMLISTGRIPAEEISVRLDALDIPVEQKPRVLANLRSVTSSS